MSTYHKSYTSYQITKANIKIKVHMHNPKTYLKSIYILFSAKKEKSTELRGRSSETAKAHRG
eukprot:TRINITY_DN5294_c0_g1_i1.p1 TRINITY_DN5294_c0_g1~~TRINITY_DN5294_c0_g1_i1.p1  ORF type:complete len:62 (+),score=25.03 TRINITY_DN5294_c0_g1_i1:153-338(+)